LNECDDTTNALIIAWIPLVEKTMVATNMKRRNPPLFFVTISTIVVSRKEKAFTGNMLSNNLMSSSWKFGIGINGMRVKRNIVAGMSAMRRLKAMAEALVTSTPFWNPFITKFTTWFIETPSNPGRLRFCSLLLPL
jgi:hypothetical protein